MLTTCSTRSALLALLLSATALLFAASAGAATFGSVATESLTAGTAAKTATADLNRDGIPDVVVAATGPDAVHVLIGHADGTVSDTGPVSSPGIRALATGDVNRDGRVDVVTVGTDGARVFLGDGTGALAAPVAFPSDDPESAPGVSVEVADLNRDGWPDLAIGDESGYTETRLGSGDSGLFGAGLVRILAGGNTVRVVVADVNGDGKLDFLGGRSSAGGVNVRLGSGDGTYGSSVLAGTQLTKAFAVGDVNRDGKPDLVVGSTFGAPLVVLPGNGDGTFGTAIATSELSVPSTIRIGDVDHDGKPDLAVTVAGGVHELAGNGDGTFAGPQIVATAAAPTDLALADLTGDALPELVAAAADGSGVGVAENTTAITPPNVRSTVTPQPVTGRGPVDTVVADVNRDGIPDLVVAEQTEYRVAISLGNGDGTYADRVEYWPGGSSPTHPVVADMNRDGIPDIVVGNALSSSVSVMLGNGDGTFKEGAAASVTALGTFNNPQGVVVGDFNQDGKPDVAVSTGTDGQKVLVLLGNGDGTLGTPASLSVGANLPDLAVGDVNGDGKLDLVAAGYTGTGRAYVIVGNGDGTFAAPVPYTTGAGTWAVRLADLDRDGDLDLVTANLSANTIAVLKNNGNGTFAARTETPLASGPRGLDVGDVDGDGNLDVVESAQTGTTIGVLYGNGDGTLDSEAVTTVGSDTYAVALGDLNRDGRTDIVAPSYTTQKLYLLLAGVDGTAPTTTDNVPAWATSATFRPTLTATDTGGGAVSKTYYELGSPPATPSTSSPVYNAASKPSMTDGQQISYFSVDTAGNAEAVRTSGVVHIDNVRPVSTASTVPTTWQPAPVEVTITATDATSGIASTLYRKTTSLSCSGSSPNIPYDSANKPTLANGERLCFRSTDVAGNVEMTVKSTGAAKVDTVVPTTSVTVPTGWQPAPVAVTLTPTDTGGSGVDKTYYEVGASPDAPTTASAVYDSANKPTLTDGQRIAFFTVDGAGNAETPQTSAAAQVDGAAPATSDDVPSEWRSSPVSVTLDAVDVGPSGVDTTYYEVGASPATPTTSSAVYDPASKPVLQNGEKIAYFSVDVAGNAEAPHTSAAAQVDTGLPETELGETPADPTSDARPTVAFSSPAPEATFECALDGGTFAACTSPFRPADALADGDHEVQVRAISRAGLVDPTPATASFTVDTTAPAAPTPLAEPPAESPATTVSIAFGGDEGSSFTCRVDGGTAASCTPPLTLSELAVGDHVVEVVATDAAGNASAPLVVRFAVTKPAETPPAETPPGDAPPAPRQEDPTRLLTELGAPDGSGRRPAILIAGVTGIACKADRGTIAGCTLEARSLRSLLLANGRRLPAGSVLAKGATAAGVAPGRALAAKLALTAAGRSALARHPLGMTARLVLASSMPGGTSVTGSTRVRLMASDTLVVPFAGRGTAVPRDVRQMLDRLVRTVAPAKAVRCTADTDAGGSAAADRALTLRQAKAACAYLKSRGLKSRLTAQGRGHDRPRASNRTSRGRALNRRLTITITL